MNSVKEFKTNVKEYLTLIFLEERMAIEANNQQEKEVREQLEIERKELQAMLDEETDSKKRIELLDKLMDNTKEFVENHRKWQENHIKAMDELVLRLEEGLHIINPTIYKIYSKFTKKRRA